MEKILLIRRDNIGDLVCTTPMFAALRKHYPDARIDVLVNSYNGPVIEGNPYIDHLYAYTKAKHRLPHETVLGVYWRRLLMLWAMRQLRYDWVIVVGSGYIYKVIRMARLLAPRRIVAFVPPEQPRHVSVLGLDGASSRPLNEVEDVYRLLAPLHINDAPGPTLVIPDFAKVEQMRARCPAGEGPLIGVHISSRLPRQRWSVENFVELICALHAQYGARCLLLWSPGRADNPFHPGDDEKAAAILAAAKHRGAAVQACATQQLADLMAALSLCEQVICSDGGAMHIAAGLGKPMVCFFGGVDETRWYPWQVAHVLLSKPSGLVEDISPQEALAAYAELCQKKLAHGLGSL